MKRLLRDYEVKNGVSRRIGAPKLKITLRYGALESTCEGSADEALRFIFNFIKDVYPSYELVRNLTLTVDLERLLGKLKDVISFLPRGRPVILKPTGKLTDSDLILTYLVAVYAGNQIGMAEDANLSMADLLDKTGKPAGTVAGRLSELVNELHVERVGRGKYRVTAYGVKAFTEEILPKLEGAK
ncbi:MAG: hypothetical protein JSW53_02335 [Candidatus Bathyarchaeota archaeon]|nr:MAG: hypothetical protein JSW53_02335 [Candidatus Bathyarchaeota archaeon]